MSLKFNKMPQGKIKDFIKNKLKTDNKLQRKSQKNKKSNINDSENVKSVVNDESVEKTKLEYENKVIDNEYNGTDDINNVTKDEDTKEVEEEKVPVDAQFVIDVSPSKLTATLTISEPLNGGRYITTTEVNEELSKLKIVYGIDNNAIEYAIVSRMVGSIDIAFGVSHIDGDNARIIDHFDKVKSKKPLEKADGTIDFKCLDFIDIVNEGDVISELVPHTEGTKGTDIFGKTINCKAGKPLKLSAGSNTYITEDGLLLIAEVTGYIHYKGKSFSVEDILTIKEDVNNTTGNIEFNGNVVIGGDVCEGYTVRADGDVLIKGSVIGSSIYSKKNVVVEKGINGSYKGNIHVDGDLTSKFIENCNVVCRGNIYCENILNSTVVCNNGIDVTSGRGVIVGGNISSSGEIKCKCVGSSGGTSTNITIGMTLEVLNQKNELVLELQQLKEQLVQIEQNIMYINGKLECSTINEEINNLLIKLKKEKPVNLLMQRHIQRQLVAIYEELSNNKECKFTADIAYYHTDITLSETNYYLEKDYINVKVFLDDEGNPTIEKTLKEF